jgi:hypothetical protein
MCECRHCIVHQQVERYGPCREPAVREVRVSIESEESIQACRQCALSIAWDGIVSIMRATQ